MGKTIKVEGKKIGGGHPCFLTAEAGTTCNGDLKTAKELADLAADAGFDAIKFQTIDPEQLSDKSTRYRFKAGTGWSEENMYDLFKGLTFSFQDWQDLADHVRSRGLIFFSTADSLAGVDILEACNVPLHKMGAWDVTYEPLIIKMAQTGKPLMLDLGPARLTDILNFLDVVRRYGQGEIILLHDFHTERPEEMNMRNIGYLKETLGVAVGFSSPGLDHELDILALGLGAEVLEKRITLSRNMTGHHHALSLEPQEMRPWIERMRFAGASLGSREIRPSKGDRRGGRQYLRSICSSRSIRRGEPYGPSNLDGKRPGTGLPTRYLSKFWGAPAPRDIAADTLLRWEDLYG